MHTCLLHILDQTKNHGLLTSVVDSIQPSKFCVLVVEYWDASMFDSDMFLDMCAPCLT